MRDPPPPGGGGLAHSPHKVKAKNHSGVSGTEAEGEAAGVLRSVPSRKGAAGDICHVSL